MNGIVPALLAALLAEIGPRALILARAEHPRRVIPAICLMVLGSSIAGTLIGPQLTGWADALMIAVALGFAALGQVQRVQPARALMPVLAAFWNGGSTLLAFALAARFGVVTTAIGILGGLLAATALSPLIAPGAQERAVRLAAGAVLMATAAIVAVGALRLT